jgi:hypothetical protein
VYNSKAVNRAYSRKAKVELPSLGEYERQRAQFKAMPVETRGCWCIESRPIGRADTKTDTKGVKPKNRS